MVGQRLRRTAAYYLHQWLTVRLKGEIRFGRGLRSRIHVPAQLPFGIDEVRFYSRLYSLVTGEFQRCGCPT